MELSPSERATLLGLARGTLQDAFNGDRQISLTALKADGGRLTPALRDRHACFVTLYARRERLRGCIGALVPQGPLFENVHRYTLHAAFDDPRFAPVEKEEIRDLSIHISVLGLAEPLPHLSQLVLGRHGLVVGHDGRRGVLLASVATQFGWSAEEFLKQTCVKAGLPPERSAQYEVLYFEELSFAEPKRM